MRRRDFITLVGGSIAAWPLSAGAQQTNQMRRVAAFFASRGDDPEVIREVARFQDELAKLGWLEGRTVHVDYRFGAGNVDQYPALAKELVGLHPELIVTQTTPLTAAMQQESRAIPIVFMRVSDPVGVGFVASLAQPGGNLTGLLQYETTIASKWLAMLKDPTPINGAGDVERSVATFARANGGLLIVPDLVNIGNRDLIIGAAARHRLPAVYPWRYFVTAGGLMSYGIDDVDLLRDAAFYVDRILRGANPADLPVQAPTKYETVVNLKTAKALGLNVPPSLLVRADEVIE
jgi:putative tryptophan/tyrosine transport system substrate-binding protein